MTLINVRETVQTKGYFGHYRRIQDFLSLFQEVNFDEWDGVLREDQALYVRLRGGKNHNEVVVVLNKAFGVNAMQELASVCTAFEWRVGPASINLRQPHESIFDDNPMKIVDTLDPKIWVNTNIHWIGNIHHIPDYPDQFEIVDRPDFRRLKKNQAMYGLRIGGLHDNLLYVVKNRDGLRSIEDAQKPYHGSCQVLVGPDKVIVIGDDALE